MYQTIVIPLDGSATAESAIAFARNVAPATGAKLILVRVVPPPRFSLGDPVRDVARRLTEARTYLDAAKAALTEFAEVETVTESDTPADAIVRVARRSAADLIVMVTHGRSELGTMLLGSTGKEVVRRATCPVLLIPSAGPSRPADRPRHILIVFDRPKAPRDELPRITELARTLGATVTLLRVLSVPTYADPEFRGLYEEAKQLATSGIERLAAQLKESGITAQGAVASGELSAAVSHAASELRADLILLPREVGGKPRGFADSVTASVLRTTELPVLVE